MTPLRTLLSRATSRLTSRDDAGFALVAVLGTMAVVSVFLFSTLAYALQSTEPSKGDQDAKTALAAAQAGIDDYLSRLTADDTYYDNEGVDPDNRAFYEGQEIFGTEDRASFRYRLLTDAVATGLTGAIRLQVTGISDDVERTITATFAPDGFVKYLYFTDLESADPLLYRNGLKAAVGGLETRTVTAVPAQYSKVVYTYEALPTKVDSECAKYYYAGRSAPQYTSGDYWEFATWYKNNGDVSYVADPVLRPASAVNKVTFPCGEVAFGAADVIRGPLHSNDALKLTGGVTFKDESTQSSWPDGATPARNLDALWWGPGAPSSAGYKPRYESPKILPSSNSELIPKADPLATPPGPGCLYTGETRITFVGNTMKVLSPGTATSVPRCYNTATRNTEQTLAIPPVIYVQEATTCGSLSLGYPRAGETTAGRFTTDYNCRRGNAFVSGVLNGRVSIGTSNDVIVVGNTTYANNLDGSDVLGLLPQNNVWIYHPVTSTDSNLLTAAQSVCKLDAAVLAVSHSLLVQNFNKGAPVPCPGNELVIRGAIAQRHRGPVSTTSSGTLVTGYNKNYTYDKRLLNSPPPFFLRPESSPWRVLQVTD